ncbi:MAG: hypothetical protein J2P54_03825 [Bradyrhizobiaceae bacterium]|nr:hypothetical protein [Bradyrhizobiaceae bacterium]
MFPLNDPMFYVCMITSVTVIYLAALAGSGRDDNLETSNEKITPSAMRDAAQKQRRSQGRI